MITFTNCKINLGLDVTSRRTDGYHDISTCMLPMPWHDIIEVVPTDQPDTTLTVLGNKVDCEPEKNLVMKAYRLLQREFGLPPVDIILQKIVPDGAGLGGGSSDATHTLMLLNDMLSLGLSREQIARRATSLGADCAFFAYDRPMLAEGIGELLTPIDVDLRGYTIVIAKPEGVNISTREAYEGIVPRQPVEPIAEILKLPVERWQGRLKNDFEESILPKAPAIARLKEEIMAAGAEYTSMSGSGASVYGIFRGDKMSDSVTKVIEEYPHFVHRL